MTTHTILAASQAWPSGILTWSTLGAALFIIGIVATYFSSRRYLLGYLIGGMSYFLAVEGVKIVLTTATALPVIASYVIAFILTLFALFGFGYYLVKREEAGKPIGPLFGRNKHVRQREKYIEHTPIYNNYNPKFRN